MIERHWAALLLLAAACSDTRYAPRSVPSLPDTAFAYSNARVPLPRHFLFDVSGSAIAEDNTPAGDRITDAGATLGRVLFYDMRLSANDRISCASCHKQEFGFADTARFSAGVNGAPSARHVMALANARFYVNGRFFRDERAATLEQQVLVPITDPNEMAMPLSALSEKLRRTPYYPALFRSAFGTPEVDSARIARALAQFVRSLTSYRARYDLIFRGNGPPNAAALTAQEREGWQLFARRAGCARCHRTSAFDLDRANNIGLDSAVSDSGAGGGRFKAPALRNVAVRPPYMHDGRFATLNQVVDFYDHGIHENAHLDPRLRGPDGTPARLHLTGFERDALVAFLTTLTDSAFLRDERFSDPFAKR